MTEERRARRPFGQPPAGERPGDPTPQSKEEQQADEHVRASASEATSPQKPRVKGDEEDERGD